MNEQLQILAGFLEKYSEDVVGHSAEEPPPQIAEQIRAFANGKLDEAARVKLSEELKENPHWIRNLAEAARPQMT
jgi:hypothetical protein